MEAVLTKNECEGKERRCQKRGTEECRGMGKGMFEIGRIVQQGRRSLNFCNSPNSALKFSISDLA